VEGSGCKIQEIEYFTICNANLYWSILGKKS